MFSNTLSTGHNVGTWIAPRVDPTTDETGAATPKEPKEPKEPTAADAVKRQTKQERQQRQEQALRILGQYDLLMKYAVDNQKSIPQTRAYFRNVAFGYETEPVIKDWFISLSAPESEPCDG